MRPRELIRTCIFFVIVFTLAISAAAVPTPTTISGSIDARNDTPRLTIELHAYAAGSNKTVFLSSSEAMADMEQMIFAGVLTTDRIPDLDIVIKAKGEDRAYRYTGYAYLWNVTPSNHQKINVTVSRMIKPLPPKEPPVDEPSAPSGGSSGGGGGSGGGGIGGDIYRKTMPLISNGSGNASGNSTMQDDFDRAQDTFFDAYEKKNNASGTQQEEQTVQSISTLHIITISLLVIGLIALIIYNKKRHAGLYFFIIALILLPLLAQETLAAPLPQLVRGDVYGPNKYDAEVNVTFYDAGTGQIVDDGQGRIGSTIGYVQDGDPPYYALSTTLESTNVGTYYIHVDVNNSVTLPYDVRGHNESETDVVHAQVSPRYFNIMMHHPLTITTPFNESFLNYTYFDINWTYPNNDWITFNVQIDNDPDFSSPERDWDVNDTSYAMLSGDSLPDDKYYLRVRSYDVEAGLWIDQSSIEFTVDTTDPQITDISPLNESWHNSNVNIQVTTDEDATCRLDTSSGTPYDTKPTTLSGGGGTLHQYTTSFSTEGDYPYFFQCRDLAGNTIDLLKEEIYLLRYENTHPVTTNNYTNNDTWTTEDASITLSVSDASPSSGISWTRYCMTAGCNPTGGTAYTGTPITFGEGYHILRYRSRDIAGNTEPIKEIIIKIDQSHPTTSHNYTLNDTWTVETANIELSSSDPAPSSGITWTRYCTGSGCDPETGTDYGGTLEFTEGIHVLRWQSKDNVDNYEPVNELVIRIDQSHPVTSHNYSYNDTWINTSQTINLSTIDPGTTSGINWTKYCIGSGCDPVNAGTDFTTPLSFGEGIHYLRYAAQDMVNNTEPVNELIIRIDLTDPNTIDNFADNDTWINGDPTITINERDTDAGVNSGINWTRYCTGDPDCVPAADYTTPVTISAENETYLRYYSRDIAGNIQDIRTLLIKLDKSGPTCSAASIEIAGGAVYSDTTTLNFNYSGFTDPLSGLFQYHYAFTDSNDYVNPDADTGGTLTGASQGTVTIFVWAEDNVNNLGCSVSDSIIVDTIAPTFTDFEQEDIDEDSSGPLNVNATITDATTSIDGVPTIRYRYGGGSWSGYLPMSDLGGGKYGYDIPEHPSGWNLFRNQQVRWEINVTDIVGNERLSPLQSELIESINDQPYFLTIQNYSVDALSHLQFWVDIVEPDNDGVENQVMSFSSNVSNISITKFNNSRALVEWQPDNSWAINNQDTNHTIEFTVSDDGVPAPVLSGTQLVQIQVNFTNEPPVLDPIGDFSVDENGSFWFNVTASDPNAHSLTFYDNTSLFDIDPLTGVVNYTPSWDEVGVYDINISVADYDYNVSEIITLEVVNVENNVSFFVRDRILNRTLDNITVVGGHTCAEGCNFNYSLKVIEPNGNYTYNLTKEGFSGNYLFNQTIDDEINYTLAMNDTEPPSIDKEYIEPDYYLVFFDKYFKINISDWVGDNWYLSNATYNYARYDATQGVLNESGSQEMVYLAGNETHHKYNATIGRYNTSFILLSNITAYDLYGNEGVIPVAPTQFIFIYRTVGTNFPPVLDPIKRQYAMAKEPYYYQATGFDLDETPLTFADNASFFDIDNETGEINFTPTNLDAGVHDVNISLSDGNATDFEVVEFVIDTGNNVTFRVWDDLLNQPISNVELRGGRNCVFGCQFDHTMSFIEASDPSTYTFTAPGFNTTEITFASSDGQEVDIYLHDSQAPQTEEINLTARLTPDGKQFYIDIYAHITDTVGVDSVEFDYTITDSAKDTYTGLSATIPLPLMGHDVYVTSIGPFAETIYLDSRQLTRDLNGNTGTDENALRQFFFNSQNVTSPHIVIAKDIQYVSQTLYTVTYRITDTIYNTAGEDMNNVQFRDTDINSSFQYFSVPKEESVTLQGEVTYNKAANSGSRSLVSASASIWGQDFYSNAPTILIPGFGGPFDLLLYPESTVIPSESPWEFDIYLENMNPDFGQDAILTYWSEAPNGSVIDKRVETLFVQADSSLRVQRDLVPIQANTTQNYRLRANISWSFGEGTTQSAYAARTVQVRQGTCSDGVQNQGETKIDCGGPCEDCPTCDDGIRNQDEIDVDCGGSICPLCPAGFQCTENADCDSDRCLSGYCFPATCDDGIQNQGEADVDCGGPCDPCGAGFTCKADNECASGECRDGLCVPLRASCSDGRINNGETGVDCGGPCSACGAGESCRSSNDCRSGNCALGTCLPATCSDNIKNQGEADVDCGGPCVSCIFKNDQQKDPSREFAQVSGYGMTSIKTEGDASLLSLSTYFTKDSIRYEEEMLVENIIRNKGYGVQQLTVTKVVPEGFSVRPVNHTSIRVNDRNQTVVVWEDTIRGQKSRHFNYFIIYDEKYELFFDHHSGSVIKTNKTVERNDFLNIYEKRRLDERLRVRKELMYKENTENVSVRIEFTNDGEVPLRNIDIFELIPYGSSVRSDLLKDGGGRIPLPELAPADSYAIIYETTAQENLSLLPEIYGLLEGSVEAELIIDSEHVVIRRFVTFITFGSALILIFLGLNTAYLYNVHVLKNKKHMPLKEAAAKAFYDTLLSLLELSVRLYASASAAAARFKSFLQSFLSKRKKR